MLDLHRLVLRQSVKGGNISTQQVLVLQQVLIFFKILDTNFPVVLKEIAHFRRKCLNKCFNPQSLPDLKPALRALPSMGDKKLRALRQRACNCSLTEALLAVRELSRLAQLHVAQWFSSQNCVTVTIFNVLKY